MKDNYILYSPNILGRYKNDDSKIIALFTDGTLVEYTKNGEPNRYTVIDVSSDELGEAFEWLKSDRVSLDNFDYIDTFSD